MCADTSSSVRKYLILHSLNTGYELWLPVEDSGERVAKEKNNIIVEKSYKLWFNLVIKVSSDKTSWKHWV